ncbi:MAG: tetratricopeptide repeat protein [Spirochaetes bacterium]|nr:tetratricopeptide repeat protein [Spirochaetota bacterium]
MTYIFFGFVGAVIAFFVIRLFLNTDEKMLHKGYKLEKDGKYDDAYILYENALRKNLENYEARWRLGNLAFKKGVMMRAVSEFQTLLAIRKFPENVRLDDVRYMLGYAYLNLNSLANAFVEFYKIVEHNPNHSDANMQIGVIFAGQEKMDDALRYIKKSLSINPVNANANYYLGLICAEKGEFQDAISYLEKTIKITPNNAKANLYLGLFYKDKRMLNDAIKRFQHVANSTDDPQMRVDAYRLLGMSYKERGLIDEAITNYEAAANESRGSDNLEKRKDILYNLSMAYTKTGSGEKALAKWKDIHRVDNSYKDVEQLIIRGRSDFDYNNFIDAVNSWERIITKEGARLKGSGLLKSSKRFDIDRLIRELGGDSGGADLKDPAGKTITEKFIDLNIRQFTIVSEKMLRILGFSIEKRISSNVDTDFEEGKALAYLAVRRNPKNRKLKRYLIQIRRWRENVGPIPIRNCIDMVQELGVSSGLFMVTSLFTDGALNASRQDGRLQLIDKRGLIKLLKKAM